MKSIVSADSGKTPTELLSSERFTGKRLAEAASTQASNGFKSQMGTPAFGFLSLRLLAVVFFLLLANATSSLASSSSLHATSSLESTLLFECRTLDNSTVSSFQLVDWMLGSGTFATEGMSLLTEVDRSNCHAESLLMPQQPMEPEVQEVQTSLRLQGSAACESNWWQFEELFRATRRASQSPQCLPATSLYHLGCRLQI